MKAITERRAAAADRGQPQEGRVRLWAGRVGWLLILWILGVTALGLVALSLKAVMRLVGLAG